MSPAKQKKNHESVDSATESNWKIALPEQPRYNINLYPPGKFVSIFDEKKSLAIGDYIFDRGSFVAISGVKPSGSVNEFNFSGTPSNPAMASVIRYMQEDYPNMITGTDYISLMGISRPTNTFVTIIRVLKKAKAGTFTAYTSGYAAYLRDYQLWKELVQSIKDEQSRIAQAKTAIKKKGYSCKKKFFDAENKIIDGEERLHIEGTKVTLDGKEVTMKKVACAKGKPDVLKPTSKIGQAKADLKAAKKERKALKISEKAKKIADSPNVWKQREAERVAKQQAVKEEKEKIEPTLNKMKARLPLAKVETKLAKLAAERSKAAEKSHTQVAIDLEDGWKLVQNKRHGKSVKTIATGGDNPVTKTITKERIVELASE